MFPFDDVIMKGKDFDMFDSNSNEYIFKNDDIRDIS